MPKSAREPVVLAFLVAAIPVIAAFVLQVIDASGADIPLWIKTVLTGLGPLIGTLAALWARSNVTPLADPHGSTGVPLIPAEDPNVPLD